MASSIASSLLRRTLRLPLPSPLPCRHHQPLFFSFLASTRRPILPRSLGRPSSLFSLRLASIKVAQADEHLRKELKEVIDHLAKQEMIPRMSPPEDFPFEIIDNPGDQTIILKRQSGGESIRATVFMNFEQFPPEQFASDGNEYNEGNGTYDKYDNYADSYRQAPSMIVEIDKGEGPILEFVCSVIPHELSIVTHAMKKRDEPVDKYAYTGPRFLELDDKLQEAFHGYLAARGINGSLFDFLEDYMTNKVDREYLPWLNTIQKIVEK